MAVVRFSAYRRYEATRVQANNAMMGLLAGAQLADHLLQLTDGSRHLLPEVYPRVRHIGRFNLTTEAARAILQSAETHLGAMSVPYALAIHEDFCKECLSLLERAGRCSAGTAERTRLVELHAAVETATGGVFDQDDLILLDTLRVMRNCMIHQGGRVSDVLERKLGGWTPTVASKWSRLAGRSPRRLVRGEVVTFGQSELILTLAVTKALARRANELLQPAIRHGLWAELMVADLYDTHPGAGRAPDRQRKATGFARYHYGPLGLTPKEIAAALARHPGA